MSETTTYNQPITRSCVTTKLDGSPLLIIFVFFKKKHADPSRSFAACDYEAKFTPTANYNALVRATRLWVSAWENDRADTFRDEQNHSDPSHYPKRPSETWAGTTGTERGRPCNTVFVNAPYHKARPHEAEHFTLRPAYDFHGNGVSGVAHIYLTAINGNYNGYFLAIHNKDKTDLDYPLMRAWIQRALNTPRPYPEVAAPPAPPSPGPPPPPPPGPPGPPPPPPPGPPPGPPPPPPPAPAGGGPDGSDDGGWTTVVRRNKSSGGVSWRGGTTHTYTTRAGRVTKAFRAARNRRYLRPGPKLLNGQQVYEVSRILESRVHRGQLQYRVEWEGWPEDRRWQPASNLKSAASMLHRFHHEHRAAAGPPARLASWVGSIAVGETAPASADDEKSALVWWAQCPMGDSYAGSEACMNDLAL